MTEQVRDGCLRWALLTSTIFSIVFPFCRYNPAPTPLFAPVAPTRTLSSPIWIKMTSSRGSTALRTPPCSHRVRPFFRRPLSERKTFWAIPLG
ncbi:hypothetical protein CspHIS471_0210700 [Cutaneotrichosporon sp. HIS471]|nr:hypothetical protein CspHIS471_0210700 [Cutaneotrichosporon sp. HIS471]